MEPLRRLIRPVGQILDARLTCSRDWEPYASRATRRKSADQNRQTRRDRPSASELTWLCLMLVMCLATVLDLHASARRESQRVAALSISADRNDIGAPQEETIALANPVHAKPVERGTRSDAARRGTFKTQQASHSTKRLRVYTKQQVQAL